MSRIILSVQSMLLMCLIFVPVVLSAADPVKIADDFSQKIYIDPEAAISGDGSSPNSPFQSWSQVNFSEDTAYLQKRGTTDIIASGLAVGANNVLLGAYGPENFPRPIINSTSTNHIIDGHGQYITIRDLEITSATASGKSGIRFAIWNNGEFGTIYNCYIHGLDKNNPIGWGVRFMGYSDQVSLGNRLLASKIMYTGDDGIFVQNARNVEIGNTTITKVNQHWFTNPASGGDGIQLDSDITNFHIHHSYVDRTDTGNKQGIIINPSIADATGIIENNHIIINGDRAALFCGSGVNYRPIIRNNIIKNSDLQNGGVGIYLHADYPEVYNNVLIGHSRGISLISPLKYAKIHHNSFHAILYNGIYGYQSFEALNNIFNFESNFSIIQGNPIQYQLSHNLFLKLDSAMGTSPVIGDPRFVNPDDNNFHIRNDSVAIDAASSSTNVMTDADGRPRRGKPDIGAYEYYKKDDTPSFPWILYQIKKNKGK